MVLDEITYIMEKRTNQLFIKLNYNPTQNIDKEAATFIFGLCQAKRRWFGKQSIMLEMGDGTRKGDRLRVRSMDGVKSIAARAVNELCGSI